MSSRAARTLSSVQPCKSPVDHLNNKHFSYLLEDSSTDATTPLTPNGPQQSLQVSEFIRRNGGGSKKKPGKKPRTSSIQVETTKTQSEELDAIRKEVEFLQSSVPHFAEIYDGFRQQWSTSQRSKTDAAGLTLIQALTEWIHLYGNKAVKEYEEFKRSAETEILAMVSKVERLNREVRRLSLVHEEAENEKREALNALTSAQQQLAFYRKKAEDLKEEEQNTAVTANTIHDLEKELDEMAVTQQALKDKYERVEKYWKMTQDENDELRNRNYALEEENQSFKSELRQNRESINVMNRKHEKAMKSLQIEHENYAQQMHNEQEKLIAAQQQNVDDLTATASMTPTGDGYLIDADDTDIAASGITEEDAEEEEIDVMGAIVSLENEINVYQYEDDEWLDDDSLSDTPMPQTPEPDEPEPVIETKAEEEYNKQIEFTMEKTSDYQNIHDVTAEFVSSKMSFNHEQKEKEFEFESESMKIEVNGEAKKKKNACFDLQMSSTNMSHTPKEAVAMEFESASSGVSGRSNELITKESIPKPQAPKIEIQTRTITKRIVIERGAKKEEKVLKPGKNFADRLAMFKHLDETRGGKPQILAQSQAYALITKHQNKFKLSNAKNIHVTKTTHTQAASHGRKERSGTIVNVLKVTKKKEHCLKPRLFGYMNVIRSSFVAPWKAKQKAQFFFVLDGLPSLTNIKKNEAEQSKNREHDFLVPTLFFFQDKRAYDKFYDRVKTLPTRSVEFQKQFAHDAKGTFALNSFAMETNLSNCMKKVNLLNIANQKDSNDIIKLPISEINACGGADIDDDDLTVLLCNGAQLHRFVCKNKRARDKWVKKVNKLVDKRARRLTLINQGLMSSAGADDFTGLHTPKVGGDGQETPPMVIGGGADDALLLKSPFDFTANSNQIMGRATSASCVKLTQINDVEAAFD